MSAAAQGEGANKRRGAEKQGRWDRAHFPNCRVQVFDQAKVPLCTAAAARSAAQNDLSLDGEASTREFAHMKKSFISAACLASLLMNSAQAGVFTLPHFVLPSRFSLGLEPELILSSGAGAGVNAKFTYGVNDLTNLTAILGTGGGPRGFRVGGSATFDFFPDLEGQPSIGVAVQGLYLRIPNGIVNDSSGAAEFTAIPYIHKAVKTQVGEIEPYLSVPFGLGLSGGNYTGIVTAAVGSMFKVHPDVRVDFEVGVAIANAQSYISGGVTYFY